MITISFNSMIIYKGKGGKGGIGNINNPKSLIVENFNVFSLNDIGFPKLDDKSRNNIFFDENKTDEIIPEETVIQTIDITGINMEYGNNGGKGLIYDSNMTSNITGAGGDGVIIIRFNKDFIKLQEVEEKEFESIDIIKKNL